MTIQAQSSGGSSSGGFSSFGGGSSSDRDNSGSTGKVETTTKPDGTKIQTETKKDGTKVETTTAKDGSTSKTTTNPNGSSVTETKAADGSTGTVKTDKHGQTTAETTLSSKAIEDAKRNGEAVKAPVEVKATRNSDTAPTVKVELPKNSGDTKVEIPVFQRETRHGGGSCPRGRHRGDRQELPAHRGRYPVDRGRQSHGEDC